MLQLRTFWTAPPTQIRVYPCPQCQEIISVDAPTCRFCHVSIDAKTAGKLWAENQQITTAITRASTFYGSSHLGWVVAGYSLWLLWIDGSLAEIGGVFPLLALSYGAQWLNHNSSLVTDDPDFLVAVKNVKKAMVFWGVSLLIQTAGYLLLNGLPDLETILELFLVD